MQTRNLSRYYRYKMVTSDYPELILGEYIPPKLHFGYMYKFIPGYKGYDPVLCSHDRKMYLAPIQSIMNLSDFYRDRKIGITDEIEGGDKFTRDYPVERIKWIPVAGCFFSEPLANMSYSAILEHGLEHFTLDLSVGSFDVNIPTVKQYCTLLNQTSHSNELLGHPYYGEGCWCKESAPIVSNDKFFQGHYAVYDSYGQREIDVRADFSGGTFLQLLLKPKALYSSVLMEAYYKSIERHEAFQKKAKEIGFFDDIYNQEYQGLDVDF